MPIQRNRNNAPSFKSLTPGPAVFSTEDSFKRIRDIYNPAIENVIHKSKISYNIFKGKMDSIFYDCARTNTRTPTNPLGRLQFNDEKLGRAKEKIKQQKMKTGQEAREFINDEELISARIVLDNGTQAEGNRALNRLIKAAEQKSLIIREIRTYGETPQSVCASPDKINGLLIKMNQLGYACSKVSQRKSTGYHGIHIKCQLEDGFMGTIEIMGNETSKLKDVEDVLHRLSEGKPVDKKFADVEDAYYQLTDEEKGYLINYTKASYMQARADEMSNQTPEGFMPITNYKLPEIFDFNNLAKIA